MMLTYNSDKDNLIDISEIPAEWYRRPGLYLDQAYDSWFPIRDVAIHFDTVKDNALERDEWIKMKEYQASLMLYHGVVTFKLSGAGVSDCLALLWKEEEYISEVPSLLVVDSRVYKVMNEVFYLTLMLLRVI